MSSPPPPSHAAVSLEDRPDYMLEAFMEEQHILVKPLLLRRLSLLATLDLKSQMLEKRLETLLNGPPTRPPSFASPPPAKRARSAATPTQTNVENLEIESLQKELLAISDEKISVAKQLQDVALRQVDVLLEVEGALEGAVKKEKDEQEQRMSHSRSTKQQQQQQSSSQNVNTSAASSTERVAATYDEEVWCCCRRPDDGRPMVACDNNKCTITWWHGDCLERYVAAKGIGSLPEESGTWICPICMEKKNMTPHKIKIKSADLS